MSHDPTSLIPTGVPSLPGLATSFVSFALQNLVEGTLAKSATKKMRRRLKRAGILAPGEFSKLSLPIPVQISTDLRSVAERRRIFAAENVPELGQNFAIVMRRPDFSQLFSKSEQAKRLEQRRSIAPPVVEACKELADKGALGLGEALRCQEFAQLLPTPAKFPVRGIAGSFRVETATEETGISPEVLEQLAGIFGRALQEVDPTPPTPAESRLFAEEFIPEVPEVTPMSLQPVVGISGAPGAMNPVVKDIILQLLIKAAREEARRKAAAEAQVVRSGAILNRRREETRQISRVGGPLTLQTVAYTYFGKLA